MAKINSFSFYYVIYFGFISLMEMVTIRIILPELIAAFQSVGQLNTHFLSLKNCYKLKCTTLSSYLVC